MSRKYVIIGNSAAGIGAVEGIRQIDKQGDITLISNEPFHTYSRPLISYLLLGKTTEEKMRYRSDSFYTDNNVNFVHANAEQIDAKNKQVVLDDKNRLPYDKLLIAAGSSAFVPPFEGLESVKNKFTFMSLDDAKKIEEQLGNNKKVLIVGAGLIGLKCAEGISKRAGSITVVDLIPRILSSILDENGAKIVQQHIEKSAGVEFKLGRSVKKFENNTAYLENVSDSVTSTQGGETINFDLLVLAVGVRPNTALLKDIAIIERGIVVNNKSQVFVSNDVPSLDIYAAGDCTQTLDISSGQNKIMALLPNAYMQGECAGENMAGALTSSNGLAAEKSFDKAIPMNAIGFFDLHMITAGNYTGEVYEEKKSEPLLYKKLFYSDNKLNGYILIGEIDKAGIYTSLIREQTPLDSIDFAFICEKPALMAFSREMRAAKLGGIPVMTGEEVCQF